MKKPNEWKQGCEVRYPSVQDQDRGDEPEEVWLLCEQLHSDIPTVSLPRIPRIPTSITRDRRD